VQVVHALPKRSTGEIQLLRKGEVATQPLVKVRKKRQTAGERLDTQFNQVSVALICSCSACCAWC